MHTNLLSILLVLAAAAVNVNAHGYLSSPPPRGIQKVTSQVDDLKSPNRGGKICRGEPEGQITNTGHSITLGFTITAPHTGPCEVYILDTNLGNPVHIASKYDCAAPGKVGPWTVTIPSNITGRKVLRWYWEGRHVTPGEPYEQCIDLNISGGGGYTPAPTGSAPSSADSPPPAPSSGNYTPPPPSGNYTPPPPSGDANSSSPADQAPDGDDNADDAGDQSPANDTAPDSSAAPDTPAPATPAPDTPAPATPAPDTPAPDSPAPAQDSSKDCGCKPGTFTCRGERLGQCSQGKWYFIQCPSSLKCVLDSPVNARCDWPSAKSGSGY